MNTSCELFENIASYIWDEISKNNKRGNILNENGLTINTVIGRIQDYIEENQTTEIFAQRSIKESERGGDLELYLEVKPYHYLRFILQAKVLKKDGYYHDVLRTAGKSNVLQSTALKNYGEISNSLAYYIFYNGTVAYEEDKGYEDCKGSHSIKQFGCTIADIDSVVNNCSTNKKLKFELSDKVIGKPWRSIPCYPNYWIKEAIKSGALLYIRDDIDLDPHFDKIFEKYKTASIGKNFRREDTVSKLHSDLHKAGFSPVGRVIINLKPVKKIPLTLQILS